KRYADKASMRKLILSRVFLALIGTAILSPLSAQNIYLVGKKPAWENGGEEPVLSRSASREEEDLETPNHRRQRLGLPITPSFPAQEYGAVEETPNHRRCRLGLAADARLPDDY